MVEPLRLLRLAYQRIWPQSAWWMTWWARRPQMMMRSQSLLPKACLRPDLGRKILSMRRATALSDLQRRENSLETTTTTPKCPHGPFSLAFTTHPSRLSQVKQPPDLDQEQLSVLHPATLSRTRRPGHPLSSRSTLVSAACLILATTIHTHI